MTEPPHDSRLARAQERDDKTMRHLFGTMICPRCGRPLQPCDHSLGIAWRCQRCGGQSLNFSQFRRMVPEHGANAIWDSATGRPEPPRQRTLCPECHLSMAAVLLPVKGRVVELDICRACQRLWLDCDEDDGSNPFGISLITSAPPAPGTRPRLLSWFGNRSASRPDLDELLVERDRKKVHHRHSMLSLVILAVLICIGVLLLLPSSPFYMIPAGHYGPYCAAAVLLVVVFYLGRMSR